MLLAADAGPALGRRRGQVLDELRAARSPLGAQAVAERVGVHVNTARFHLDALVEAGLAVRAAKTREARGRPSITYQAVAGSDAAGLRHYRLLAEMLASLIAGMMAEPGKAAVQAGRAWGRHLTEGPLPFRRLDAGEAIAALTATLAEIGFAPQSVVKGTRRQILLHDCPFREVAQDYQDVVCSLHLGLMQGALAQMKAPVTAQRLQPFAEPGLCIAHLAVRPDVDRSVGPATP